MILEKEIVRSWVGNKNGTILFTIPSTISKQYGLDQPTYVVLEPQSDGILLRKLNEKMEVSA